MDACSLSFDKSENIISKKLCLTSKDLSLINANEGSDLNNTNIEKLESMYSNPYALLKEIDSEISKSIKFNNLKPSAPVDRYSWLNNLQVDQIQDHFAKLFKGYTYSYIHMSDLIMFKHDRSKFVKNEIKPIKKMDFEKLVKSGKTKYYGVVFNTDTSKSSGQHWFSIFIDFTKPGTCEDPITIEYFNSAGTKILENLKEFFIKLAIDLTTRIGKLCTFVQVSNIPHQADDTGNCGVFSLFYIYSRLSGIDYKEFGDPYFKIDDDIMTQVREIFFNDEKKYK